MDFKKIISWPYLTKNPILTIGFIFFISVILKISFIHHPFYGLEYEDAFIYLDVSRYLLHSYDWSIDFFQTKCCIDGSLSSCNEYSTFGGHYMIFPLIVSAFHIILGYSLYNIFIVNFIASLITLLFFIKILRALNLKYGFILFASLLFITTPFLNLFNTSGLVETISSCFIMITFYFFLKSFSEDFNYKKSSFWLFIFILIIAFMTKRENLILISLPVLSCLLLLGKRILNIRKLLNLFFLFVIPFTIAIIYNQLARINEMELRESIDIGTSTFSITNFRAIFPKFIFSFFNIGYFGIAGILFLLTSLYIIFFQKRFEFHLILVFVWMYIFLYSVHYRSYYQVHFGQINIFETLRYSSNYFPLACLCFASINFSYNKYINHINSRMITASIIVLFVLGMVIINIDTRKEMSKIEFEERIRPVKEVLKITTNKDYILSDITCIFHLYATDERSFIDSYLTSEKRILQVLNSNIGHIYFLRRLDDKSNVARYPEFFKKITNLKLSKIKNISTNYELLKLNI